MPNYRVITDQSTVNLSERTAKVIIEVDTDNADVAIEAFNRTNGYGGVASAWAAQNGLMHTGLNPSGTAPYPVNSQGEDIFQVRGPKGEALPSGDNRLKPAAFRMEVNLVAHH